jgi:GUN4-like
MNAFQNWLLLRGKSIAYVLCAIVCSLISFWSSLLDFLPIFFKLILGISGYSLSIRFFILAYEISNSILRNSSNYYFNEVNNVVNLPSGTYNESLNIDGDYVQGDKHVNIFKNFNFTQSPSAAIQEIREIILDFNQRCGDVNTAQQLIIDDLIRRSKDDEVKRNLIEFSDYLGLPSSNNIVDIAEQITNSLNLNNNNNSFLGLGIETEKANRRYQRLIYLLKTARWREGDEETVRIVKNLMPPNVRRNRCADIDVDEISRKQLQTINRIWLEASGGRFGLSVQKHIWIKIHALDKNKKYMMDKSRYDVFTEAVGWSNDRGLIYHVDFDYKITSCKGYLPAKILLLETYNPGSNYCRLSNCLFDDFMKREYSDFSFIPSWIRRWLVLE